LKKERFLAIYYALKKLVQDWVYVCFLGLYASEWAIDNYWLRADLEKLVKDYPKNFAYGPALAHHTEVVDMLSQAWAVVTDSWSMQEEASVLWVPCVTIRFWSDRSETILDGQNVLAPPINSNLIADIVKGAIDNKKMRRKNLYWKNVSKKIVDWVLEVLKNQWKLFRFDDERLELSQFFNWKI
jgi:UDP-N-acetylglucosamine 2-epimerase (non-hydrolysing)